MKKSIRQYKLILLADRFADCSGICGGQRVTSGWVFSEPSMVTPPAGKVANKGAAHHKPAAGAKFRASVLARDVLPTERQPAPTLNSREH